MIDLKKTEQTRTMSIDLIKVLCFFLVVLIHVPFPGKIGGMFTAYARVAVPMYFALSGYFYSEKVDNIKKAVSYLRIYIVLNIMWSLIYEYMKHSSFEELAEYSKLSFNGLGFVKCILFGEAFGNEYLWFLHALAFVYFAVYIGDKIRFYVLDKRLIIILFMAQVFIMIMQYSILNLSVPSWITRNWIFTGLPFFGMGYLLKNVKFTVKFHGKVVVEILAGIIIICMEYIVFGRQELYFGTMITLFGLFDIIKNITMKDSFIARLGRYSMGLYLIHPAIWLAVQITELHFGKNQFILWMNPVIVICVSVIVILLYNRTRDTVKIYHTWRKKRIER